jgi:hypothetical protein
MRSSQRSVMAIPLPQRVPQNAPGDFYVQAGMCTACCLPHGEAPDLLNDAKQAFHECFFRRQPQTPEEVDRAISALWVSEVCALRYAGSDPQIIAKLRSRDCGHLCDQTPEGQAWLNSSPVVPPAQQMLDYHGPERANESEHVPIVNRRSVALAAVVVAVVLLANFVLAEAAYDNRLNPTQILIRIGPITNGVLCAVSFAFTPLVKRFTRGPLALHILASLLPIAAMFADVLLIGGGFP